MRKDLLKHFEQWMDQTCDSSNRGDHDAKKVAEALVFFYRQVTRIATDEDIDAMRGFMLIGDLYSHPKLAIIERK